MGTIKPANTRRCGVFRVKILTALRISRATMSCAQVLGETGMKEATKRATSEALAHMLAVTALLVIASVLFYSH